MRGATGREHGIGGRNVTNPRTGRGQIGELAGPDGKGQPAFGENPVV